MNVLFVTEDHSKKNFGITAVVSQLADEIVSREQDVRVYLVATDEEAVLQNEQITISLIPPVSVGTLWRWSPGLKRRINEIVDRYNIDIIHIHGIWMAVQFVALTVARQRNIPCIVSAHGMLEAWLWSQKKPFKNLKKKLYFKFFFKKKLTATTRFHAITSIEKENLKHIFPGHEVVVVPNAINLEDKLIDATYTRKALKKHIVFLGRLHPVKGLDILVDAFVRVNLDCEWELIIAGPESDPEYVGVLQSHLSGLDASNKIKFIGPVYGAEKIALIRSAWVVVVPSYSEVVGMVNLEAAANKTPSITTYETGLADWEQGGGLLVHPVVEDLSNALKCATQWSIDERLSRGEKSLRLVQKRYSWDIVVLQWTKVYSEMLKEHPEK